MLAELGWIILALALVTSLYSAFASFRSARQRTPRWAASSRNSAVATVIPLGLALIALLAGFLSDQFQLRYVAQHSSRELPISLKLSVLWAGQEGSLLLWAFLQALFAALAVGRAEERARPLIPWASVFLNVFTTFFVAVTLFFSNPFATLASVPADGQGLNPLLRHPGMVFHPPALYLGYVGLAVPCAFALAALVTRRLEDWPAAVRRWTLASWLFLGLGLFLGARWAYDVLGWGGYWGWDPVENAGLMPWLTATALLHGTAMQDERRGFRAWNVVLAISSFALVLLGTFITRSGLIESVHAYARSDLGAYFLTLIISLLVVSGGLMVYARKSLTSDHTAEGLLSRGGMFLLALLLLLTLTGSVLVGSLLPTITEALGGERFEAGPAWFDRVTGPQFAALALVLGLCPLLGRAAGALRRLRRQVLPALLIGVSVTVLAALAGFTRATSLVAFAIVGLAGGTALVELGWDVVARARRSGEDALQAAWQLVGRNRRRYGGYLVHIGVVLMALGIVGTRMAPFETELVLSSSQPAQVQDYTLVYEALRHEPAGDHLTARASVAVYRNGAYLVTLQPEVQQFVGYEQPVSLPALRATLREDLYVVLAGWDQSTATFKVLINPLASFLWLGGLVVMAGGAVALWPPRADRLPVLQARRRSLADGIGLAAGLLVLVAAGVAMWGPGHGVTSQASARPLPGQPAPDFTLTLLDGSSLSLSDLRGQLVVLNFWATWCSSCYDELPDLQALWEEYRSQGVTFVGIAYQDEEAAVREVTAGMGLTYPIGLDLADRVGTAYGITGVPETVVVDSLGQVAFFHIGPVTAQKLAVELDKLLAARPAHR